MSRDEFIKWLSDVTFFTLKSANIYKDVYEIDSEYYGCHHIEVLKGDYEVVVWEDIDNEDEGRFTYEEFIKFWKDLENEIGASL